MEKDNPARRLLHILQKLNTIPSHESTKNGWYRLLEISNKNDEATLFKQLGKLMTLPNIILEDIKKFHPKHENVCQKSMLVVSNALYNQNMSGQWQSFTQFIKPDTIDYLELISTLLDYEYKMDLINDEKLSNIRKSVDALIKEVSSSTLDVEFKKIIMKYLKKIIDSIDEYNIMGVEPIIESIEITAGHAILNKEFGQKLNETNLSDKFRSIFEDLITLVNSGNSLFQLGSNIINFLPK